MNALILIRHSNVTIDPDKPAARWTLSDGGRTRAFALAEHPRPYHLDQVITSIESKAVETGELVARELQIPFATALNLREHERSRVPYLWDVSGLRHRYASFMPRRIA